MFGTSSRGLGFCSDDERCWRPVVAERCMRKFGVLNSPFELLLAATLTWPANFGR